jgi:hypothetical protein
MKDSAGRDVEFDNGVIRLFLPAACKMRKPEPGWPN